MINAIKIDAEKRTVEAITIDNKLEVMQKAVDGYIEIAHYFDKSNVMYVNEEGLLRESNFMFTIKEEGDKTLGLGPFAGNAIIVGTTKAGDTASHSLDFDVLKSIIKFIGEYNIDHRGGVISVSKKDSFADALAERKK